MLDQVMGTNPIEIIVVIVAIAVLTVPAVNSIMDSVLGIKDKLIDRKAKRIIDAAIDGDQSLRDEIARQFLEASEEHDEFRRMFDNDKRAIDKLTGDLQSIQKRIDGLDKDIEDHETLLEERAKGEKVIILSLKASLNEKIGIGSVSDLVDAVAQIDEFLIEGRK